MVKQCDTKNPVQIAKSIGVKIAYSDQLGSLLGLYTYRWKNRIVILNDKLQNQMLNMVLAHELGHDAFHRDLAKNDGLKEFELFNIVNTTEYEANAYAAHILIDDDEAYSLGKEYDLISMAKMLNVNVNLLLIKLQELNKIGYNFRIPYEADNRFFRKPSILTSNEL